VVCFGSYCFSFKSTAEDEEGEDEEGEGRERRTGNVIIEQIRALNLLIACCTQVNSTKTWENMQSLFGKLTTVCNSQPCLQSCQLLSITASTVLMHAPIFTQLKSYHCHLLHMLHPWISSYSVSKRAVWISCIFLPLQRFGCLSAETN